MEDLFLMAEVLSLSLERARFLKSVVNQGVSLSETLIVRIGACFSVIKDSKDDHCSTASFMSALDSTKMSQST